MRRLLLALLWGSLLAGTAVQAHGPAAFSEGEKIEIECKDGAGGWTWGLRCVETSDFLSARFWKDDFFYCSWKVEDEKMYAQLRDILLQKEAIMCRVPMDRDRHFFLPMTLPIWGIVEESHLHVNYHMNIVFHADDGHILGVSAYPVRDRFQFVKVGTTVNFHGPIHWFRGHSFRGVGEGDVTGAQLNAAVVEAATILGWIVLTFTVSALCFAFLYVRVLKPRLAQRYLKQD